MRISFLPVASGLLAAAFLTGCGGDVPPPATLTADEEAAAEREMQEVENAERAHFGEGKSR